MSKIATLTKMVLRDSRGEWVKGETTKGWKIGPSSTRAIIDIYNRPVCFLESDPFSNPDIRSTLGVFAIKYVDPFTPGLKVSKRGDPGKPYRLIQDLTKCEVAISGPADFHRLRQKLPEFQWIYENTTYDDELFKFARQIPNFRLEFTIDWVGYNKRLKDQFGDEFDAFTYFYCDKKEYDKIAISKNQNGKIKISEVAMNKAAEDEYNTNIKEYKERLKELTSNEQEQ